MEYDSTRKQINVSLKMTAHDFEMVLERKFGGNIELEAVKDSSDVDLYIKQYLSHNLQLSSGGKRLTMNYLGKEVTNRDDLYFYLYYTEVGDPTTIDIKNKLLFSVSDQQQNIVHYKYGDRTKSVTLIPAKSEETITFNGNDQDD